MGEFFKGWRRKVGCVTLVMACVVTLMWMRSLDIEDSLTESKELGTTYFVGSRNQQLLWAKQEGVFWKAKGVWEEHKLGSSPFVSVQDYQSQSRKNWCGFRFEVGESEMRGPIVGKVRLVIVAIPYWSLVLPLTLLSAYLILWKPRKRKAESDA